MVTALYFRPGASCIPAVPAIIALCVGDGLAETFGVAIGGSGGVFGTKWQWSKRKTMIGSVGGFLLAGIPACLWFVSVLGTPSDRAAVSLHPVAAIMLVSMLVESLDVWSDMDNVAVTVAALIACSVVLPQ